MAKCDTLHCDNDADPETGLCGLCQGVEELDAAELDAYWPVCDGSPPAGPGDVPL